MQTVSQLLGALYLLIVLLLGLYGLHNLVNAILYLASKDPDTEEEKNAGP
jgi:hypothetical protein